MNTAARSDPRIQEVRVNEDEIIAHLVDGRVISVPLAWSWRLSDATPAQRANFRLIGTGQGIHWHEVDEDISVEGLLAGRPSGESQSSFKKWLISRSSRPARSNRVHRKRRA